MSVFLRCRCFLPYSTTVVHVVWAGRSPRREKLDCGPARKDVDVPASIKKKLFLQHALR